MNRHHDEMEFLRDANVEAVGILRRVRSDRPSVHSDELWDAVNGWLAVYAPDQPAAPPEGTDAARLNTGEPT